MRSAPPGTPSPRPAGSCGRFSPRLSTEGSLAEALGRLTETLADETGMTTRFLVTGDPHRLAAPAEVALLRAAQEGTANIRKHADAGEVVLTLSYLDDRVVLDVRDDGRGFDIGAVEAQPAIVSGGHRPRGLTARLAALGGELDGGERSRGGHGARRSGADPAGGRRRMTVNLPIRVLVVDDHPVVRTGVRGMLDSHADFDVVGEASDGKRRSPRSLPCSPTSC